MAAKKKAKTAKRAPAARKAKKAPARKAKKTAKAKKSSTKKSAKRPAQKTGRRAAAAPARKAPPAKARAGAAKPAKKKQQSVGEGDYEASRAFLKDQSGFVEKNKDKIPAMGREAADALEGPEGDSLRSAEADAADRSREMP